MFSLYFSLLLGAVPGFVFSQQALSTPSTVTSSLASASATATATGEPCAQVSQLLASYSSANPSATSYLRVPADMAYDCSSSAPIVKQDALNLVSGLSAFLEWQSTLSFLKDPPSGYAFPAIDLLGGMQDLYDQVNAGKFANEVDFQTNLTTLLGQAHDGHLEFQADALSVFSYVREGLGQLVSVSMDGTSLPEIYSFNDLEQALIDSTFNFSPITSVNGQDAATYFTQYAKNTSLGFQDPDALFNALFYEVASSSEGGAQYFAQGTGEAVYIGASTEVVFQNGTSQTFANSAITTYDFTGVDNGAAFYQSFCNATIKLAAANGASPTTTAAGGQLATATPSAVASPTPTGNPRIGYPSPTVLSADGSVAGYFLNGTGYEKTAVLSISEESETDPLGAQKAVSDFLAACRKNSMAKLIIDVSSNPGGAFVLSFDFFKQLFPNIEPFGASQMRATTEFNILGSFITPEAEAVRQGDPSNVTNYEDGGGYSFFDARSYDDATGKPFNSWEEFFGPQQIHGDNYTYLQRLNLSDPQFDDYLAQPELGFVVSGYGNRSNLPPQAFASDDIILFSDGQCSSSCPLLGHFLKYQGKVKSVAAGGRPQTGPMQALGGTKGSNVFGLASLFSTVSGVLNSAPQSVVDAGKKTSLATIYELGEYVLFRSAAPLSSSAVTVNVKNNIAEGDDSQTPLQFVYEAADCRIWWTPEMIFDITAAWKKVADVGFGANGSQPLSEAAGCVKGSTNAPSSLSGNATLDASGKPDNVTVSSKMPGENPTTAAPTSTGASSTAGGSAASGSAASSGVGRLVGMERASLGALILGVGLAVLSL